MTNPLEDSTIPIADLVKQLADHPMVSVRRLVERIGELEELNTNLKRWQDIARPKLESDIRNIQYAVKCALGTLLTDGADKAVDELKDIAYPDWR